MTDTSHPSDRLDASANLPDLSVPPMTRQERVHALRGAFAFVPFSSDDHIREKEADKELEE
ncbi:MAG: hypothetical protein ACWGMZ_09665 [Thermoguttaceae bacterium]